MIEAVQIADERVGDATQLEESIPFGVVACDARGFQTEDDAHLAHGHFMGHMGKTVASDEARAGVSQVFIDHLDLRFGPAQQRGALAQLVLPLGRLTVEKHLGGGGLTNVDVGAALQMCVLDFEVIAHGFLVELREEEVSEVSGPF